MTLRTRTGLSTRIVGALAVAVAAMAAVLAIGVTPASASVCRTSGHAYLTQPGRVYFSGFEGNQQFGVPTYNTFAFDVFGYGGNGIRPGTQVRFDVIDKATGAHAAVFNGQSTLFSRIAGSNCVANEQATSLFAQQPGTYRVLASYFVGNTGQYVTNDPVVDIVVQPSLPAPDPGPIYEPPPCYDYYCY
jgi:hypothetical protein